MTEVSPAPRRRGRAVPSQDQQKLIVSTREIEAEAAATEVTGESLVESAAQVTDPSKSVHLIHFLEDGLTFLGKVWYRGEEFSVTEGTEQWEALADRNGNRFLDMSENDQIRKYGRIMFRQGPWPFEGFNYDDPNLTDEDKEKLRAVEARKRGGGLPMNPRQPGRTATAKSDLPPFVVGFKK